MAWRRCWWRDFQVSRPTRCCRSVKLLHSLVSGICTVMQRPAAPTCGRSVENATCWLFVQQLPFANGCLALRSLCLQVDPACLGQLGLGPAVLTRSRANGFLNMLGEAPLTRAAVLWCPPACSCASHPHAWGSRLAAASLLPIGFVLLERKSPAH